MGEKSHTPIKPDGEQWFVELASDAMDWRFAESRPRRPRSAEDSVKRRVSDANARLVHYAHRLVHIHNGAKLSGRTHSKRVGRQTREKLS